MGGEARWVLSDRYEETRRQTESAFAAITREDCQKLVNSVQRWISQWMRGDDGGSLQQFDDFDDDHLVKNGPKDAPDADADAPADDSDSEEE